MNDSVNISMLFIIVVTICLIASLQGVRTVLKVNPANKEKRSVTVRQRRREAVALLKRTMGCVLSPPATLSATPVWVDHGSRHSPALCFIPCSLACAPRTHSYPDTERQSLHPTPPKLGDRPGPPQGTGNVLVRDDQESR